jgi:hypothetical protein
VLRHDEQYNELVCTFAMDSLVEIEAVEVLPVIRHAFALDKIDPMVRGDWGDILDQIGADTEPDDSLIAISRQRAEERRERFFPSSLRRQLNAALGNEPESAFARLIREHGPPSGPPAGSPVSETAPQQAEAQARKEKQKRKAAATDRKANRKKRK